MSALAAGLTTVVFLVGFASVRLRAQRDRALTRSDGMLFDLTRRTSDGSLLTDRDIERTAGAFADAGELDPMSRWTIWLTWLVVSLMFCLSVIAGARSGLVATFDLTRWTTDSWAVIFVLLVAVAVTAVGTAEFRWIGRDLRQRVDDSVIGMVRRAIEARRVGAIDDAMGFADQVASLVSSWPWVYAFRSQLHAARGEAQLAIADMDRAIQLDPNEAWHRVARAELFLDGGEGARAVADLESLGDNLPAEAPVWRLFGSALYAVGRREESLDYFNRAIEAAPKDVEIRIARGRALSDAEIPAEPSNPSEALRVILLDEGQRVAVKSVTSVGRERLIQDDLDAALRDFDLALDHDPDNVAALTLRGLALIKRGDFEAAGRDFEHALRHTTDIARVKFEMARAYHGVGEDETAFKLFEQSLAASPKAVTYFHRGLAWEAKGKFARAIEDYDAALSLRPEHREAMTHRGVALSRLGKTREADEQFRAVERLAPSDSHLVTLWVREALRRSDLNLATEIVERALLASPFDGELFAVRAKVQIAHKRYHSALSDLDSADALGADKTLLALDRSTCLLESGDPEGGVAALEEAVVRPSPYRYAALATRATLCRRLDLFDRSLADYDAAIELNRWDPRLRVSRGCLLMSMGDAPRALEDFNTALSLDATNEAALFHRSQVLAQSGDGESAWRDLDTLEKNGVDASRTAFLRGEICFGREDWMTASDYLRRALEAENDQGRIGVMSTLAAAYDNLGQFGDAEALFRQILTESENPVHRVRLGITLSQQGRSEEAILVFSAVVEEVREEANSLFESNVLPGLLREEAAVRADWHEAMQRSSGGGQGEEPSASG